jgi:YVTN family beta-propeller protein
MPPPLDPNDVYAADRPNALSPAASRYRALVYVPNTFSNTVSVIDPRTYRVVRTVRTGLLPQHVVPSYDLRTLWVNNNNGNTLTPIDPGTARAGATVRVADPYNLYFTPDGRYAMVMAERLHRIDFRNPRTMRLERSLPVPCSGVNHADFAADGRTFVASCEFSAELVLVDTAGRRLLGRLHLPRRAMPQDVKLSPDGRLYYVADMRTGGIWLIDARSFRRVGFLPTGAGAHGLFVSRDSRYLYVSNRDAGSISVVSFATRRVVRTWRIPGGGSPDMGGISTDGRVLWLSGRYSHDVYAVDVVHWRLIRRIRVGKGPHGLCVFPQPGRYSLGHTGVFR